MNKLGDFAKPENMDLAVQCLNELIASTLHHIPDVITYLSRLRNQSIFNFCAIPQVWIGEAEGSGWCAGDGMPGMRVLFWSVYSGMWFLKKMTVVYFLLPGAGTFTTPPLCPMAITLRSALRLSLLLSRTF